MPALTATDCAELMGLLDAANNVHGALGPEPRARLAAAVLDPSQETWTNANTIVLTVTGWTTLWQAVLEHTDYNVRSRRLDQPWPSLPTPHQIVTALRATLNPEGA